MSVNLEDLDKIAHLARLNLKQGEKEKFLGQVNQILKYVEKLNEIDTTGIEPLSHSMDLLNVMRDDEKKESLPQQEALKNAPQKNDEFFRVPKVVTR
ncbi:MAG: Asp-tRNA(Asn)/Glu-tRNA(Gln) amidotransferase subunit GatC [Calditrichaeota bacterium]|nr:MAG: Asp-tRNA(Asn)/Glu-tRNA(Gln) amidotransferase subunit GatC [Calditrichota bacterium]MBL1207843.1 Asp-tRNA(Asn)/Glu-tRNA(Gln) amidotransferase subunit GatC [Calditrichota bacterium]NOG47677.1 Asp-tRNA(Asn)/Glu-tRNA(Gln) amidotransferase subunit GatC [Calditrichota bacterium]